MRVCCLPTIKININTPRRHLFFTNILDITLITWYHNTGGLLKIWVVLLYPTTVFYGPWGLLFERPIDLAIDTQKQPNTDLTSTSWKLNVQEHVESQMLNKRSNYANRSNLTAEYQIHIFRLHVQNLNDCVCWNCVNRSNMMDENQIYRFRLRGRNLIDCVC